MTDYHLGWFELEACHVMTLAVLCCLMHYTQFVKTQTDQLNLFFSLWQALKNDAYDHYTAIYYLLLERLRQHRLNAASSQPTNTGTQESSSVKCKSERRPSTIAEHALTHPNPSAVNSTNNTTTNPSVGSKPVLANVKQGVFSRTTDCVLPPTPPHNLSQSQQQLWSDIESIQGLDVPSSGGIPISSGKGKSDLNETTVINGGVSSSNNSSTAVSSRNTSVSSCGHGNAGVGGGGGGGSVISTSIDEGVEVDFNDSDLCSNTSVFSLTSQCSSSQNPQLPTGHPQVSHCCNNTGNKATLSDPAAAPSSTLTRSSMFSDLSQLSSLDMSNQSISTGTGSAFTSFDSNIEADLMSSLSSCAAQTSMSSCQYSSASPPRNQIGMGITMTPPIATKFPHQRMARPSEKAESSGRGFGEEYPEDERCLTQSPVSFREGRRASDGLMSQHVIAFRQRLKDTMKVRGVAEIRKEMELLQNQYQRYLPDVEYQRLQEQHQAYQESSLRQRSLEESTQPLDKPKLTTKRMSLPGPNQTDFVPHRVVAIKQGRHWERMLDPSQPQQQGGGEGSGNASGKTMLITQPYPMKPGEFPSQKSLQQQLMHHRLQQKRQLFQRQGHSFSVFTGTGSNQPQLHRQFQQMNLENSTSISGSDGFTTPPGHNQGQGSLGSQIGNKATNIPGSLSPYQHFSGSGLSHHGLSHKFGQASLDFMPDTTIANNTTGLLEHPLDSSEKSLQNLRQSPDTVTSHSNPVDSLSTQSNFSGVGGGSYQLQPLVEQSSDSEVLSGDHGVASSSPVNSDGFQPSGNIGTAQGVSSSPPQPAITMVDQQLPFGSRSGVKDSIDPLMGAADIALAMPKDLQAALAQQQSHQQMALGRRHVVRQPSYKMAQQQQVLPPCCGGDEELMLWQQFQPTDPPPLSPMFEENVEDLENNGDGTKNPFNFQMDTS